ncbi:MAG: hydrolase [Dethiosulfovibrio peptidovorans]|nr:MAG: hydrolase [Dethiosulfovibrio peptidovorans]
MKPHTLQTKTTLFLLVDIQEKLLPAIHSHQDVLRNVKKLLIAAQVMSIPVRYTEQYPQGLGTTIQDLREYLEDPPFEKQSFGCFNEQGFNEYIFCPQKTQVVLFGIESHICIHTTALQFLKREYQVAVVADACGSRNPEHHRLALSNMTACGVHVLPLESVIYQLLQRAGTPEFSKLLPLFKN